MSSWEKGADTVRQLVDKGHLQRISGAAANGQFLIGIARKRLGSAKKLVGSDNAAAVELAYESARHAVTAALTQQGLRPTTAGGHTAVARAAIAQFGDSFLEFDDYRRSRNLYEYPKSEEDADTDDAESNGAVEYAQFVIDSVEKLMPVLGFWQP